MLPTCTLVVLALPLGQGEPSSDPCRKSHCTLAGDDLPLVLAFAGMKAFDDDLPPSSPHLEEEPYKMALRLLERHKQGHGGWPDSRSSKSLLELGLAPCDPAALDALDWVAQSHAGGEFLAVDAGQIARLLERNGRCREAEQLLVAALPPGSSAERDVEWREYGEFLARRGRFEEAMPLIEGYKGRPGGCYLGSMIDAEHKFEWVELCCDGMYGGTCEDVLFEKRLGIVGVDGLAEYVAKRIQARGSALPEREAKAWFELQVQLRHVEPRWAADRRERFDSDLANWTRSLTEPAEEQRFDWTRPGDVERAVARVRELVRKEPRTACDLLDRAAETGLPVAGKAVLELAADRTIEWTEFDRSYVVDLWRDAILTRTFGCANPDDPATW